MILDVCIIWNHKFKGSKNQDIKIISSKERDIEIISSKDQDIEMSKTPIGSVVTMKTGCLQLQILTFVRKTCWICCSDAGRADSNVGRADSMVQLYRDSQLDQKCNPCWGILLVSVAPHCVVSIPQSMSLWSYCPSVVTRFHCCGDVPTWDRIDVSSEVD